MYRAIITAIIEYILAFTVFKKGKVINKVVALILLFLASYQLGEFIMFITEGSEIGFRIAYFSTTLLPPLGLELVERITKQKHYYLPLQGIGALFAFIFLVQPGLLAGYEQQSCCFIAANYTEFGQYWVYYYQGTLIFTMIAIIINLFMNYNKDQKLKLSLLLLGYIIVEAGMLIAAYVPALNMSHASVMCAIAFFSALLFARIGLMKEKS